MKLDEEKKNLSILEPHIFNVLLGAVLWLCLFIFV